MDTSFDFHSHIRLSVGDLAPDGLQAINKASDIFWHRIYPIPPISGSNVPIRDSIQRISSPSARIRRTSM